MRRTPALFNWPFKKALNGSALVVIGSFFMLTTPAMAQCEEDDFTDACAVNLGEDYTFLRTFNAEEIEGSTNYPYTGAFLFRKGVNYLFAMCGESSGEANIVVNLYNRSRKLVATTFNKESGKYYDKMIFKCNATGIFFVQALMPLDEKNCGVAMLGFNAQ